MAEPPKLEEDNSESSSNGINVKGLQFSYDGQPPLFVDFNVDVSPGSRCLLVGANGSGNLNFTLYILGFICLFVCFPRN